jgi:mycofactocin glycosyltransferase
MSTGLATHARVGERAVPEGWRVRLDPRTKVLDDGRTMITPTGRLLRLGPGAPGAAAAVQALSTGTADLRQRRLGRALLEAGAGHPLPPPHELHDVTVVIPVKDRTRELARCLDGLVGVDVLVVDDGSHDPEAVAALCRSRGIACVHRANGGPAAARNTALPLLDKEFVAFVDSDCRPTIAALALLRGHLDDPAVAAAAPRVTGGMRSPLDLGPHPASVRPGSAVAFVPTACLLVRRSALLPFDQHLRYGEDVDLIWRLVDAGWQVRYDPSVEVPHDEPPRLLDRLHRRFHYGTSAAALATRHPGRLTHLVLPPWPTAVVALALTRRPLLAVLAGAVATRQLDRTVRDLPRSAELVARSTAGTALGLGPALALTGPVGWALAARHKRLAALLIAPLLLEWRRNRPGGDPIVHTTRGLLDQAAYGAGVAAGCARERTIEPLLPRTSST